MKILLVVLVFLVSIAVHAGPQHDHSMPASPKSFEQLKQLAGTWKGKMKGDPKGEELTVKYELTAGGSALMERLFVGTPHEMISMYYPQGKTVAMTHYCMEGNQPELNLTQASPEKISFVMKGTKGIRSANEAHMHSLTMTFPAPGKMTHEWISFKNKKKSETAIFDLVKE